MRFCATISARTDAFSARVATAGENCDDAPEGIPMKTGRNDPCPCGSGRKYKHCCLAKDEARERTAAESADGDMDREVIEEIIRQQVGMESTEEVDAAMRRYEFFCRNLPAGARRPSFMEFMGRPNAATSVHRDLEGKAAGRSFSSGAELDAYLQNEISARNTSPVADFEGLSPEQMRRLVNGSLESIPDIVQLVDPVPDDLAMEADLVRSMRWVLDYLADHGSEIRLTRNANFPRGMCERYLAECTVWWRAGMSVPSETTIDELFTAHEFAFAVGYLDESHPKCWITTEGAGVCASGRWGSAYPSMLRFAIDELEWLEWLDDVWSHDHFRIVQQAAAFVLRLLHRYPSGTGQALFERFATAFPLYVEPGLKDPATMRTLRDGFTLLALIGFCERFGLVRLEYEPAPADRTDDRDGGYRYETTRLFRAAFRWTEGA